MKVTTSVFAVGIRGTDFSYVVRPDGSGEIRLDSGELESTDLRTGAVSILKAGNVVKFANGQADAPIPFPAGSMPDLPAAGPGN